MGISHGLLRVFGKLESVRTFYDCESGLSKAEADWWLRTGAWWEAVMEGRNLSARWAHRKSRAVEMQWTRRESEEEH